MDPLQNTSALLNGQKLWGAFLSPRPIRCFFITLHFLLQSWVSISSMWVLCFPDWVCVHHFPYTLCSIRSSTHPLTGTIAALSCLLLFPKIFHPFAFLLTTLFPSSPVLLSIGSPLASHAIIRRPLSVFVRNAHPSVQTLILLFLPIHPSLHLFLICHLQYFVRCICIDDGMFCSLCTFSFQHLLRRRSMSPVSGLSHVPFPLAFYVQVYTLRP